MHAAARNGQVNLVIRRRDLATGEGTSLNFESWEREAILSSWTFPKIQFFPLPPSVPPHQSLASDSCRGSSAAHPNCPTPTDTLQSVRLGSELIFCLHLLPQILHILDYFFPLVGTICAPVGVGKFIMWVWITLTTFAATLMQSELTLWSPSVNTFLGNSCSDFAEKHFKNIRFFKCTSFSTPWDMRNRFIIWSLKVHLWILSEMFYHKIAHFY